MTEFQDENFETPDTMTPGTMTVNSETEVGKEAGVATEIVIAVSSTIDSMKGVFPSTCLPERDVQPFLIQERFVLKMSDVRIPEPLPWTSIGAQFLPLLPTVRFDQLTTLVQSPLTIDASIRRDVKACPKLPTRIHSLALRSL